MRAYAPMAHTARQRRSTARQRRSMERLYIGARLSAIRRAWVARLCTDGAYGTPETFHGTSETFHGTPETFHGTPETFHGTSLHWGAAICDTPRMGGSPMRRWRIRLTGAHHKKSRSNERLEVNTCCGNQSSSSSSQES